MEIELQTLHSTKAALQGTLAEVEAGYGAKLAQLRGHVAGTEAELMQLRTEAQHQAEEHQQLLDVKTRLEMEIATYQRLLEDGDVRSDANSPVRQTPAGERRTAPASAAEAANSSTTSRRVTTVIEQLLEGRMVSSRTEEVEHPV
uniref:IF rod domain-containing protein n=1 Tax=Pelodiscus sinensis TaxID=13735 RepID=K7F3Y1_PELSI